MERRGLIFVDAKLNHWHIRLWIEVAKHGPGAVVEPPILFQFNRQGSEQLLHTTGQVGITGRWIFHFIQLSWKSAEVVDRAGSSVHGYSRTGHIPMGRNAQDRLGAW